VEKVTLHWGTPRERALDRLTVAAATRYYRQGHFPEGSMGPKVAAATRFVEASGQQAIITSLRTARAALAGKTGTWIVP
jgi:carbamate kinase